MLDKTDLEIIALLSSNSRMQLKDIGESVHLTGQAAANRIAKIEAMGIIKGYSVILDESLLGRTMTAYITVFMKNTRHEAFRKLLNMSEHISEAHRISGDGCYMLKGHFSEEKDLNEFLNRILEFGNYRVDLSIGKIK